MSSLPEGIIENILTRLPVKSISRFRCVSKKWCLLFQNPNFIKNHLKHAIRMNKFKILANSNVVISGEFEPPCLYSIDSNDLSSPPFLGHAIGIDFPFMDKQDLPRIYGSCDGLVCLGPYDGRICIWNPATREYKKVPKPIIAGFAVAHGFGYDSKNNDYKVLRIVSVDNSAVEGVELFEASVYSLASNSWKNLGIVPYDFGQGLKNGFLHNGVLHLIASTTHPRTRVLSIVVVCFDLSDETFHDVPLPKNKSFNYKDTHPAMLRLGIWEGKLCLLRRNGMGSRVDVWTMMDDKWSKHSSITVLIADMTYVSPIQTLQNGEILFLGEQRVEDGLHFISYDPKLERPRAMKIHGFLDDEEEVETYVETLVPLHSGAYVGQKRRNKVPKKKQKIMTDVDLES